MSALLEIGDLHAGYVSGVDILQGISLTVEPGSVTVVIGPNGAGKSTLLRTLFGLLKPHRGNVRFAGQEIGSLEPAAIKALGIGYVPQEINVFPLLTVEENLRMGGWILRRDRAAFARALERVFDTFPLLAQRRHEPAGALSAHYAAGDVFAMPCRTRRGGLDVEGLGIVYLEASAAGLPVVGGDSGGAPDAILEGETGYVVPGRDTGALAERLVALLTDPATARAMGDKGRAWIEREWSWDLMAARLRSLLE